MRSCRHIKDRSGTPQTTSGAMDSAVSFCERIRPCLGVADCFAVGWHGRLRSQGVASLAMAPESQSDTSVTMITSDHCAAVNRNTLGGGLSPWCSLCVRMTKSVRTNLPISCPADTNGHGAVTKMWPGGHENRRFWTKNEGGHVRTLWRTLLKMIQNKDLRSKTGFRGYPLGADMTARTCVNASREVSSRAGSGIPNTSRDVSSRCSPLTFALRFTLRPAPRLASAQPSICVLPVVSSWLGFTPLARAL